MSANNTNDWALPNTSLKGTKLLIAEDNMINIFLAKQYMKMWDIECDIAENGALALQLVKDNAYDMVLMDLQMPEMDGYEATAAIRELPERKYQDLPIIALTASTALDLKEKPLIAGMNDYISKPFKPNELYSVIAFYSQKKAS